MAIQVRRVGDDLLVDNLDLKRAARSLLKQTRAADWTPPGDMNQAMELIARLAGFSDLHAAVTQASRGSTANLGSPHQQRPQFAAHSLANMFPEGLPPKFTTAWKDECSLNLFSCIASIHKGDTVGAIVGRPGSGKSVLAKVMARSTNGAVLDYRKTTVQADLESLRLSPPAVVFIDEFYFQSAATETALLEFIKSATSSKFVFIGQDDAYVSSLLERRDASGSRRLVSAVVLDLDLMSMRSIEALPNTAALAASPTPAEPHSAPGASGIEPARRIRNRP